MTRPVVSRGSLRPGIRGFGLQRWVRHPLVQPRPPPPRWPRLVSAGRRFAVEDPGAWDPVVLDEVRDVGVVLPYEDQDAFDARFAEIVRRLPVPAPA